MVRCAQRSPPGFTLIEMLVTIAIIGLGMSIVFGFGDALLPQTRLSGSAAALAASVEECRVHALVTQQAVVVAYDFDRNGLHAFYPQERDSDNAVVGPGRTEVMEIEPLREGIVLQKVVFADGSVREDGEVTFPISPAGRIAPHDVIIFNPDFPDTEVRTIRIDGRRNETAILEGRPERKLLDDNSFN